MSTRKVVGILLIVAAVAHTVVFTAACATPTPGVVTPQPATPEANNQSPLLQHLEDLRFGEFGDALGTGTVPPDMASFRNNPTSALGAMFAKVAKSNGSCASTASEDFTLTRIKGAALKDGCTPDIRSKDVCRTNR